MLRISFIIFTFMLCVLGLESNTQASVTHISLKKAMTSRLVTVNAVSNGGYCNKSIHLDLTNNTSEVLNVDIDPALIFRPEDTSYQDLVVLGSETIVLSPKKEQGIDLQTFCGKSYAHSPIPNICYHYIKQGDSGLIKTLIFAKNKSVDIYLAQRAVWSFTNHYRLNTVYNYSDPGRSEEFVKYICSVTNRKVPEYFWQHSLNNAANAPAILPGDGKIYVDMNWGNEGYRQMYVAIYRDNGEVYRKIYGDEVIDKYGHRISVEMNSDRDPKGTYFVRLHDETGKIWAEKKVIIEDEF